LGGKEGGLRGIEKGLGGSDVGLVGRKESWEASSEEWKTGNNEWEAGREDWKVRRGLAGWLSWKKLLTCTSSKHQDSFVGKNNSPSIRRGGGESLPVR
jgi:hypothetical protein